MTRTHQPASKTLVLALLALVPIAQTQPVSLHPRSPSPRIIPGYSHELSDALASSSLKGFDTAPWDVDEEWVNGNGNGKDQPHEKPSATPSSFPGSVHSSSPVVSHSPTPTLAPLPASPSPSSWESARVRPGPDPTASPSASAITPAPTPAKSEPKPEYGIDDDDDDDRTFNSLLDVLSGRIRNVLDSNDELTLWD